MATSTDSDFDSVYRAHVADVRRFVYEFVQDAAVAEELAHDAFVKALGAWDRYRGDAPARIWLLRIARNVCLDYLRSPRARVDAALPLEVAADSSHEESALTDAREPALTLEQRAVQSEMTECVQDFVRSLPETFRTPLILHDMQGLTNEQIAQVLDCSLEAAKMRLHRARGKLKAMMDQRCDLFHDERNVLSCLPAPPVAAFISSAELLNPDHVRGGR